MRHFYVLAALFIANIFVWTLPTPHGLKVSFFNVGEGDSVFLQGPTGVQLLIDGGPPGGGVLRELGKRMPFFDRTLNAVVETTLDTSESGGLVDVLHRYGAKIFLSSGNSGDTKTSQVLSRAIADAHAKEMSLQRGARLLLGGGAYADVLYPDRDLQNADANTASMVLRVVYGKTSFLFSSQTPQNVEKYLVSLDGEALKSDVLKAGQHGSKNASSPEFVHAVSPMYAVFSRGCANRFGHPAPEVIQLFQNFNVKIFDMCTDGTITFLSNGKTLAKE